MGDMTFEDSVANAINDLIERKAIRSDKKFDPTKGHFIGQCVWALKDAAGKIVKSGVQNNIVTKRGRLQSIWGAYLATGSHFYIAGDERIPQFYPMDNVIGFGGTPDAYQFLGGQNIGWSQATLTRTVTRTFAQPNATRTINLIGFCQPQQFPGIAPNGKDVTNVVTALRINPPIIQTAANTLDIVYKVTVIPPIAKDLRRFAFPGLQVSGYYFNRWFTLLQTGDGMEACLMPHTFPETMFTDGGMGYVNVRSVYEQLGFLAGGAQTFFAGYTAQVETKTVPEVNVEAVGAFGMQVGGWNSIGTDGTLARGPMVLDNTQSPPVCAAINVWPFAQGIGEIGNVFGHPAGRAYAFDEAGIVPTSQGIVDVNKGPNYIPDNKIGPAHWIYRVCMAVAGDTQLGTEGEYFIARKPWVSNPYVPEMGIGGLNVDGLTKEHKGQFFGGPSTWGSTAIDMLPLLGDTAGGPFNTTTASNSYTAGFRTAIYDGVDSWWGLQRRDQAVAGWSNPEGLMRWRIGTNEQAEPRTLIQDTRFVKDDGNPIGVPTGPDYIGQRLTSNSAGLVFYATSDAGNPTVQVGNELYAIDNSKPGRWYQRPSGDVAIGNTFTVDVNDQIHSMFPFIAGDVGKKIRIVNSLNGNSSIRTITVFNNANSVDVDGAVFIAETGMTWHFITVTEIAAAAGLAVGLVYGMCYDVPNGRLWVCGTNGIQLSTDDGATWSVILNESTPNTPLSNQDARDFGYPTALSASGGGNAGVDSAYGFDCCQVDNNGNLYWVDRGVNGAATGPAVDKFTMTGPGDTIGAVGGGTHTRIPLSAFPVAGTKPTNLRGLQMNLTACDLASGEGELWLHNNAGEGVLTAARDFYRLPLDSFTVGNITAFDPVTLPGIPFVGTPARTPGSGFVTPGGEVNLITYGRTGPTAGGQWFYWSPALGIFIANNSTTPGVFWGLEDRVGGNGSYAVVPDGRVVLMGATYSPVSTNKFGGQDQTLRYDDNNNVWIQWEGTGAQFDARFGTLNGGLRKCHTTLENIRDGVQVKFIDDPGTVTPTDQFVQNETFAFPVVYGRHRTNIDVLTWTGFGFRLPSENFFEAEAVKTAAGPGAMAVHLWQGPAQAPYAGQDASPPAGAGLGIPLLDANGRNWGWEPAQWLECRLAGQGDAPNTETPLSQGRWAAILDLGANTQVARLKVVLRHTDSDGYRQVASTAPALNRRRLNIYVSNTGTAFAELAPGNEMRYPNGNLQFGGPNNQDAPNYKYIWHEMNASYRTNPNENADLIEFDFVSAGIAALDRTRRYWQVTSNDVGAGLTNTLTGFIAIYAYDDAGNVIGMTTDHALDANQNNDPEFQGCTIDEAFWIQDEPGGAGGATTISTAVGPRVDLVTVDAGNFDTANIDITRDYLAWDEGNPTGSGFLRAADVESINGVGEGNAPNGANQAMARIIAVSLTTIQIDKATIPGGLISVAWEVRRPASITASQPTNTIPELLAYDPITGYFRQSGDNITANRRFRVTRYGTVKTPL